MVDIQKSRMGTEAVYDRFKLRCWGNYNTPFQSEYKLAINAYEAQKSIYQRNLSTLEKDLKSKGSSIFTSIKSTEIELVSLQSHLESIILVIKKHNKWLGEFGERKSAAIKKS